VVIDFKKLIRLQELDKDLTEISIFLDKFPSLIEAIDKKIEDSSKIISEAKDKLSQNQKERRDLEAEAQDLKSKITKYKQQLNDVKTNIEYSSLLKEIDETQKRIDDLEEKIISKMLVADDIEEEIKKANQKAQKDKGKFAKEKETLLEKKQKREEKGGQFKKEKDETTSEILPDQYSLYLKIYGKKNGIALSPVKDDFCSMCHMRIRPQMLNELKEENEIITCENCGRILYLKKE
jgi:predicted  nucleic acid-binding Zn-ribbon protein